MGQVFRLAVALALGAGLLSAQPKKRIAVLNFDYATVQSNAAAIFGSNMDLGKGIADLMVDRLVGGAVYTVIERKAIDKVVAEQNFANSDRVDTSSAAQLGRVLGVDVMVVGSISQFGRDDRSTNVGGGALGGITRRYGIGGVGKREAKAVVGITARLVRVETGEVVAVASAIGNSSRSGATLLGSGGSSAGLGAGGYDLSSKNFSNTLIGEATTKAVNDIARQVEAQASRLPAIAVKIQALVADVSGQTLILNVGSRGGVQVGDRLEVKRILRTVKDPATGKVIREIADTLGVLVITEVDEQSAVGTFAGNGAPKVGDSAVTP